MKATYADYLICSRFAGLCMVRLSGSCRHYSADQRFWIAATARGRFSDGSIIWGAPEHPPHDDQATTNPIVVNRSAVAEQRR